MVGNAGPLDSVHIYRGLVVGTNGSQTSDSRLRLLVSQLPHTRCTWTSCMKILYMSQSVHLWNPSKSQRRRRTALRNPFAIDPYSADAGILQDRASCIMHVEHMLAATPSTFTGWWTTGSTS